LATLTRALPSRAISSAHVMAPVIALIAATTSTRCRCRCRMVFHSGRFSFSASSATAHRSHISSLGAMITTPPSAAGNN
jgi:hypothetical protein